MSDDTLERVSLLKEKAKQVSKHLEEAKLKRAVLQDRLNTLNERLRSAVGHTDWSRARKALDALSASADEALEALATALDGVDF